MNELKNIKYSICSCNYNMEDTLEIALTSVLEQLDDRFEFVVVDDASTDNSLNILRQMEKKYACLRVIPLPPDRKRKLGETRNISIREAKGEYVLPQVDCDDTYGPHILDFIEVFHQIEPFIEQDIYLKGRKMNIGKRDFLLEYGPYRNIFQEDRDMWKRLIADNRMIYLEHESFVERLKKTEVEKITRTIKKTWHHQNANFRRGLGIGMYYRALINPKAKSNIKRRMLRCVLAPFSWLFSLGDEKIDYPEHVKKISISAYKEDNGIRFPEIMKKNNSEPDWSRLSEKGKRIFQFENNNEKEMLA